jgi:diacylglycerol kinase (ATP)
MTSWVALINPQAGTAAIEETRVRDALGRNGLEAAVAVVDSADAMRAEVVSVARSGRCPLVVGGDGTVNLAVNALVGAGLDGIPRLGVLPAGTGCDFLRTFGIPQDLESAAARLAGSGTYRIDLGVVEGAWGRRLFANVAQAGAGAAAAEGAMRLPRRMGSARYPAAFLARLPGFPHCRIELEAERPYTGPALAVIFANAQFFAGGWNVAPKAMLMDGELDVQVVEAKKRRAVVLVPKIVKGVHLSDPAVRRSSLARAELRTEVPWPVEADGDYVGTTPVIASVLPAALDLVL